MNRGRVELGLIALVCLLAVAAGIRMALLGLSDTLALILAIAGLVCYWAFLLVSGGRS